ncbi:MAG TPA: hypothetical protein VF190_14915 [Rhodothermales bacterium]
MSRAVLLLLILLALPAQAAPNADGPSRGKAFLLSLAVPGLGHRYVHQGSWDGAASVFAAADAGLWLALVGSVLRHDHLTDSYRSLAALRAGADVYGKDRTFFLTIGTYRSSDEFVEEQLRARAWDQIDYVDSRSFQWEWASEADFQRFRELREDAESMGRRTPVLVALLVGNRLLSGLLAIRSAGRAADDVSISLAPVPFAPERPALSFSARF